MPSEQDEKINALPETDGFGNIVPVVVICGIIAVAAFFLGSGIGEEVGYQKAVDSYEKAVHETVQTCMFVNRIAPGPDEGCDQYDVWPAHTR